MHRVLMFLKVLIHMVALGVGLVASFVLLYTLNVPSNKQVAVVAPYVNSCDPKTYNAINCHEGYLLWPSLYLKHDGVTTLQGPIAYFENNNMGPYFYSNYFGYSMNITSVPKGLKMVFANGTVACSTSNNDPYGCNSVSVSASKETKPGRYYVKWQKFCPPSLCSYPVFYDEMLVQVASSTLILFVPGIGSTKTDTNLSVFTSLFNEFKTLEKKIYSTKTGAKSIEDIKVFRYDGWGSKNEQAANELNAYIATLLTQKRYDHMIVVDHSLGDQIVRNAVIRAQDTSRVGYNSAVQALWKTSWVYAISPIIGGADSAKWTALTPPGLAGLVPVIGRAQELNPSGTHQVWLFSAATVLQFNSSIAAYHSYEFGGSRIKEGDVFNYADPILQGLWSCFSTITFERTNKCNKVWRDNYLRGKSKDHIEYYLPGHRMYEHSTKQYEFVGTPDSNLHSTLATYAPLFKDRIVGAYLSDIVKPPK